MVFTARSVQAVVTVASSPVIQCRVSTKYKVHSIDTRTGSVQTPSNSTDTNALSAGAVSPGETGACFFLRLAAQRSADHRGGRIPDDKFRAQFGRQHTFKVSRTTTAQGQPGFQFGGYTFVIVDAWPAGWVDTDECYVDYVDGEYFLFDLLHPGVGVAIMVVL